MTTQSWVGVGRYVGMYVPGNCGDHLPDASWRIVCTVLCNVAETFPTDPLLEDVLV